VRKEELLKHRRMFLLSGLIFLLFVAFVGSTVSAAQSDAATAISSAQNTIVNCYDAANSAEASGANITSLTETLNEAGSLLSQAELSYSQSDFDAAVSYAAQSQNKLNGFISQADSLKQAASQRESGDFLVNFVGSVFGAFAVVAGGFVVWFFLKRRYGASDADAGAAAAV
jgi:hypothetical protein